MKSMYNVYVYSTNNIFFAIIFILIETNSFVLLDFEYVIIWRIHQQKVIMLSQKSKKLVLSYV